MRYFKLGLTLSALALGLILALLSGCGHSLAASPAIIRLLPDSERTAHSKAFRYLPIASAAVIVGVGLMMTGVSLGWIRPGPF